MNAFRQFLNPKTSLSGHRYGLIGFCAFGLKFWCDHFYAKWMFGRPWQVLDYWRGANAIYLSDLRHDNPAFFVGMLSLALPFIGLGVILTLRRLNTLQLPLGWVSAFFIPYVNLLFFLSLILLKNDTGFFGSARTGRFLGHPTHVKAVKDTGFAVGSALIAVLVTGLVSFALVGFDVMVLKQYGMALFIFMPFLVGLESAWLYGFSSGRRTLYECQLAAMIASGFVALLLLCFAWEGFICILMGAPLWMGLAAFGGWVGYLIQDARWSRNHAILMMLTVASVAPLLMGAEYAIHPAAPLLDVTSSIIVRAPATVVWKHVVSFSELPFPKEWIFHSGLAYPIRAEIKGTGVGAVRRCEFSTGAFIEPIELWQEPSLLRFSVTANPPPMRELSFYSRIDPPHLHGFLVSREGQFHLTPLPDGSTRLEGTTWYQHHLWPASYWQLWSDYIIHQIHLRVLRHIKTLSEQSCLGSELSGVRSRSVARCNQMRPDPSRFRSNGLKGT